MVKDKRVIRLVLSVIALSVSMGINAEYIEAANIHTEVKQVQEIAPQVADIKVITVGKVRSQSVERVRSLMGYLLSAELCKRMCEEGSVTLVAGSNLANYINYKFNIPIDELQEGKKLSDSTGIDIICSEEQIEEFLPQIVFSLETYYRLQGC